MGVTMPDSTEERVVVVQRLRAAVLTLAGRGGAVKKEPGATSLEGVRW